MIFSSSVVIGLLIYSYHRGQAPNVAAVWHLRWLFLSILVLYLLFPPVAGVSVMQALLAGLTEAIQRITALVVIVLLVQSLFALTDRRQLLAGLLWLLQPFGRIGLPVERFALRLTLVLEIAPRAQSLMKLQQPESQGGRLTRIIDRLTTAFECIQQESRQSSVTVLEVPLLAAPASLQWLTPLLLLGLFVVIWLAV